MARAREVQIAVSEFRRRAVELFRELRFRELQLDFAENVDSDGEIVRGFADAARHRDEDAVDLFAFVFDEADEVIVLLDGLHRLDVDSLAARAGAVDDAGHASFLLGFDRDDEALAADGDQLILPRAGLGEAAQMTPQRFLDDALLLLDLATQAGEIRRGVVVERAV